MIRRKKKNVPTKEELFQLLLENILDEKAKKKWELLRDRY